MSIRSEIKGWIGEALVDLSLAWGLRGAGHRVFSDLIVPSSTGLCQIDHVVVSRFGVFVIETKSYSGTIHGSMIDPTWLQVIGRRRFTFQNPLRQNYRHTRSLSEHLAVDHRDFHSIVVFNKGARLRIEGCPSVLQRRVAAYIRSFITPVMTQDQADEIGFALAALKLDPAMSSQRHRAGLKRRHPGVNR